MIKRVWAEIDLDAIRSNFALIKQKANGAKICCVIKDNAYGHGAVKLAKLYEKLGANYFAVSNIGEAIDLRNNQIETPILILGYTPIENAADLVKYNITQCVYSLDYAKALNDLGLKLKCHLKVDSGMNRLGFKDINEMLETCKLPNLYFEGIFTHFADSKNKEFSDSQFAFFMNAIKELNSKGINFEIRHCANSDNIFMYPEHNLDMVRPGIILYGLGGYPGLKQALKLKSVISHIHYIKKGESVGYSRKFIADKEYKIATIPVGYGDGFLRYNSGRNTVLINGKEINIVGNICMDQFMADVTDHDVKIKDEVTIYNDLEAYAANIGTISYELICNINNRVPLLYLND